MPNPGLEIRGGGGGSHPDPYLRGARSPPQKNFRVYQKAFPKSQLIHIFIQRDGQVTAGK